MRKQIIGLLLLAAIACFVATCSATSVGNSQSSTAPSDNAIEEGTVAQNESVSDQDNESAAPEEPSDDSDDPSDDKEENNSESSCRIDFSTLEDTSGNAPQFECALLFGTSGEVKYTEDRRVESPDVDVRDLKSPLLKGKYYKFMAEKEASSSFLLNTLDLLRLKDDADLTFQRDTEIDSSITFRLDFLQQLVVINPVLASTSSDSISSKQPSNGEYFQQAQKSWPRSWWKTIKAKSSSLRTALIPGNLLIRPAFAKDFDASFLDNPSLVIETPDVDIASKGAVYVVKRMGDKTQVFSLTEQPIKLTDKSNNEVFISRNQTAVIEQGEIVDAPYEFRLCGFYRDNRSLVEGLAPQEFDFVRRQLRPVQFSYHAARSMTVPLYHQNCQRRCPPPPRGSA